MVVAGLIYFCTTARDIVVGDSPELITVAVTLGVPHAPGYPLFTMLGHLFSLVPFGPIPFRVNLFSALCDTFVVGVVYLTAFRLGHSRMTAVCAALLLATNSIFWSWSLEAEVFPINNLLISLTIYFLIAWRDEPDRSGLLIAASFLFGLALSNHQTSVLIAPAICFLLVNRRTSWAHSPQLIFACAVAIAAGFLPYLYVPWAAEHNAFFNWGNVSSLRDLIALILRRSYGSGRLTNIAEYTTDSPWQRIYALCRSLGPAMALLATLGMIRSYQKQRWYFWFILLAFGFSGIFFVAIANLNLSKDPFGLYVLERFFLASQVVLAPSAALGILAIAAWSTGPRPATKTWALRAASIATLTAIIVNVALNYRKIDQSHNHIARLYAEDVFSTVPPNSTLLVNGDEIVLPLGYLQAVEHLRSDVNLVIMPLLTADWYLQELRERDPHLFVPFDRYDPLQNNLKRLAEANLTQKIIVAGKIPSNDQSFADGYWLYRRGLIDVLEPKDVRISIDQAASDNEQLLDRYHIPDWRTIKVKGFESNLLLWYAISSAALGREYERLGEKSAAEKWSRRAATIDPYLPKMEGALAPIQR
jgi:hypothetical protein